LRELQQRDGGRQEPARATRRPVGFEPVDPAAYGGAASRLIALLRRLETAASPVLGNRLRGAAGVPQPAPLGTLLSTTRVHKGETMGLISGLMKAGVAKKAFDAANKPENQRKIKELVGKARAKKGRKR